MDSEQDRIHQCLLEKSYIAHKSIHQLISKNGIITLVKKEPDALFQFLARIVIGQQLSSIAAASIWSKIEKLKATYEIELPELFSAENEVALRSCGISKNKLRAINGLVSSMNANKLNADKLLESSYNDIVEAITSMWGFGKWSADMCSIFYCALPDVYPESDAAINQGMKHLCNRNHSIKKEIKKYTPYRTYLCLHIWAGIDNGLIAR